MATIPTPQGAEPSGPMLSEQIRVLRDHRWLILAVTVAVTLTVMAWTFRQPRIYSATCTVEYDPNPVRPLGDGIDDVAEPTSAFWMNREFFETQNRIIGSRQVAERVVRQLGLHMERSFFDDSASLRADWAGRTTEQAARVLQDRTTIEMVRGTRLVNITIRDRDAERAAVIANALAEAYIEKTVEDRMDSTVRALEWLDAQLDNLRQSLDESELALHRFKQEHNVLSVSMEDRQNLVASDIERFNEALANARTRRIEVRAHLAAIRGVVQGDLAEDRAAALSNLESIAGIREQLLTKTSERQRLSSRYGARYPQMQELDAEIESLRSHLNREIDAVLRSADAELREVTATEEGLRQALEDAHEAGLELNLREIEYTRLQRARENNAKLYQLLLERTTETDLTRMLRTTHIRIVDRALRPERHISPRVSVNTAGGLVGGVVLGLALAFLLARLDRRLRSVPQIEDLGVAVLGIVPRIEGGDEGSSKGARRRRGKQPQTSADRRDIVVHSHPMSSVAEQCRIIRTNLMFMGAERPMRTLVLSSPEPQDGKTTVITNLAISFAQSGKRVLVVDTDLRRPRLHLALALPNRVGMSSILVGESRLAEVVQDTPVPNLFALTSGPVPPNPSELLHLERFGRFIDEAREAYDFVLFDTPPLGVVTDASIVAPQVDGLVLIVKANKTTREALRGAIRRLNDVGGRMFGAILNDVDPRRDSGGEKYGPYYYSSHSYYGTREEADASPRDDSAHPS